MRKFQRFNAILDLAKAKKQWF